MIHASIGISGLVVTIGTSVVVIGSIDSIFRTFAAVATSVDSSIGTSVVVVVGTVAFICTSAGVATSDDSSIGTSLVPYWVISGSTSRTVLEEGV